MRTTWVNHESRRYYSAYLIEDLFGDWTLIRVWGGGQGSRRGSQRCTGVASYENGMARIEEIARRRRQHGYERIGLSYDPATSKTPHGPTQAVGLLPVPNPVETVLRQVRGTARLQQGIRLEAEWDQNERVRAETVLAAQRGPRS